MHQIGKKISTVQYFQTRKIMGKLLLTIILSNFLYSFVQTAAFKRTTESFKIHYLEDRKIVPVKIVLNSEQQTEHILSSRGEETLYDFNQGKVAYKDTNSSQCFIADIAEESFEGDRKRLRKLRNGTVRGFYLPTFIIQEEFINGSRLLENFGGLLTQFCEGNNVSSVVRKEHRRKRDTSGDKGQFTHHSYGHYGHQSNNYAHYGHETHITGTVDKDGQIRNQAISQQQIRSDGSQSYPDYSSRSGPASSTHDSRMGISSPQSQTQHQMPSYQQSLNSNGRNIGAGGSGQFSLQTAQESGYQLNLPLGLKAGNAYRSGIRSAGHYGVGGLQPQISTEYQRYPGFIPSAPFRPGDQTSVSQTSLPISSSPGISYPSIYDRTSLKPEDQTKIRQRTLLPDHQGFDETKLTHRLPGISSTGLETSPGISSSISPTTTGDQRVDSPQILRGTYSSGIQTDSRTFIPNGQRQHDVDKLDYDSRDRKIKDQTGHIPNGHRIPPRTDDLGLQTFPFHPKPGISVPGIQTPVFQPGISMPSMHIPSNGIHAPRITGSAPGIQTPGFHTDTSMLSMHKPESPYDLPRQILPGSQTTGTQRDLIHQRQFIPSGISPTQQFGQIPGMTYPRGDSRSSQVPVLYPPSTIPGHIYPSSDRQGFTHTSQPVSTIPGEQSIVPGTVSRSDQATRNGLQYPDSPYYQQVIRDIRGEYPGSSIPSHVSAVPGDIRDTTITGIQPGYQQFLPRETGPIPPDSTGGYQVPITSRQGGTVPQSSIRDSRILSRGTEPRSLEPVDRTTATDQVGRESLGQYSQDSASSRTQIQTNVEGTAAEASAAGQYRGLGSQTQVQGGYAGNGSFSAQAQSGFTGGVVQSQVQGSKQGGLSGSSSQVERVGSAQSQVQVGQPSGAASSTAQGRFSGGITQVQTQSGKSGGSAGAQAQSTGLSSSHVQVNIGGNDVNEKDRFQGTVLASVQGGHSSGQSQTQMQGGYESGRTYVATAQGGFDSLQGFEGSVPPMSSLTRLSNRPLGTEQLPSIERSQGPSQVINGRPTAGSIALGLPTGSDFDEKQISQTTKLSSRDQTADRNVYTYPVHTLPDQTLLQSGRIPQQQLPSDVITKQSSLPTSRVQESRIQYPTSEIKRPSPEFPSYQPARYPDHTRDIGVISTGTGDERQIPVSPDFPSYRGYNRGGTLPSVIPEAQQPSMSQISGHQIRTMQPTAHLPATAQSKDQIPTSGSAYKPRYPSSSISQRPSLPTDHMTHIPSYPIGSIPQLHRPDLPTDQMSHVPSYPSSSIPQLQIPDLSTGQIAGLRPGSIPAWQTGHYPHMQPPLFSSQPQVSAPSSQTIPSHHRPDEMPVLTRPGATHLSSLQPASRPGSIPAWQTGHYPYMQPPLFPGQPQVSSPASQTIPSHHGPDEIPVLTRPDATHTSASQPGVRTPSSVGQPQIRPVQPQITPTPRVSQPGMSTPTETTAITQVRRPGVSEPDANNCCEALRDLKSRCCNGASKNNGASSCCKSTSMDDIFDFSSEDKLDEKRDGPCKVVKAICYIVYKPIGKARVCKPTQTNGC